MIYRKINTSFQYTLCSFELFYNLTSHFHLFTTTRCLISAPDINQSTFGMALDGMDPCLDGMQNVDVIVCDPASEGYQRKPTEKGFLNLKSQELQPMRVQYSGHMSLSVSHDQYTALLLVGVLVTQYGLIKNIINYIY